jgi:hypothetical protein
MKLTDAQIGRIEDQYSVSPIPEGEPIIDQLAEVFGDHTFYLGESGLVVWDTMDEVGGEPQQLVAVQLAEWSDDTHSEMRVHDPVSTGIFADMNPENTNNDEQD